MNKKDILFKPSIYSDDGYLWLIGFPVVVVVIIVYFLYKTEVQHSLLDFLYLILFLVGFWLLVVKFYSTFSLSELVIRDGYLVFKRAFNRKYGVGNLNVFVEVMPKLKVSDIVRIEYSDEYQILGTDLRKAPSLMHIRVVDELGQYLDIPYRRFLKKDIQKLINLVVKANPDVTVDDWIYDYMLENKSAAQLKAKVSNNI